MNVLKEQCITCIFRPGNPMSLNSGRVQEMVKHCLDQDTFIPCHERMQYVNSWADEEAEAGYEVTLESPVCRGFYDIYYLKHSTGQMIRIAERLNMLREID